MSKRIDRVRWGNGLKEAYPGGEGALGLPIRSGSRVGHILTTATSGDGNSQDPWPCWKSV